MTQLRTSNRKPKMNVLPQAARMQPAMNHKDTYAWRQAAEDKPVSSRYGVSATPIFATLTVTGKRNHTVHVISFIIHAAVFSILYFTFGQTAQSHYVSQPYIVLTRLDVSPYIPHAIVPVVHSMSGGGGEKQRLIESNRGKSPPLVKYTFVPEQAPKIALPQRAIMPTAQIIMPENNLLPNLGIKQSAQIVLISQDRGSGSAFGQGTGGGMGNGNGSGAGTGSGGNYGGGLMSVGGGVSAPRAIFTVEPEFTESARLAAFQGSVSIQLIVDSQGNPQNVHVTRHLGMGLDESAIDAVRQYKFAPAIYQGHAVAVQFVVNVNFHLH